MTHPDVWREDTFGPLDERIAEYVEKGLSQREITAELGLPITEAGTRIEAACRRLGLEKPSRDPYEGFRRRRPRRPDPKPARLRSRPGLAVGVFGVAAIAAIVLMRLWPSGGEETPSATAVFRPAVSASLTTARIPPMLPPYVLAPRYTNPPTDLYYSSHAHGARLPLAGAVDPMRAWWEAMLFEEAGNMDTTPR